MDLFGDLPEPTSESKKDSLMTPNGETQLDKDKDSQIVEEAKTQQKRKAGDDDDSSGNHENKKLNTEIYALRGYAVGKIGERDEMQDAHCIIDNFLPDVQTTDPDLCRLSYYGVFDGHAGARAARFSAEHLHRILANKFPNGNLQKVDSEIKKCLIDSFKSTDEEFLARAAKEKPSWKDGTTAVTVLAINNTLYIANLGDSKAVLCRYNTQSNKFSPVALTKDHSPDIYDERIRIQKAGGNVRDGRVMGVLEVSRSIGDGPYKKHGVICLPDVRKCQLTEHDWFVLIACDGLWKSLTPEASIEFINKVLEDPTIEGNDLKSIDDVRWETACASLAGEAVRRLSADNVTVLLVRIGAS